MWPTVVLVLLAAIAGSAHCAAADPIAVTSLDRQCASLDTACEDLWQAIQCQATKKCIPRWERLSTMASVGNDTELCATCKKMVEEARDQLLNNETQAELREVLEGSCKILLPPIMNEMCAKLMDTFLAELTDVLVSRMDPGQVCSVAGLCWKSDRPATLTSSRDIYVFLTKQHDRQRCEDCQRTIERAAYFSRLLRLENVIEIIVNACRADGSVNEAKCLEFAHTYGAKFFSRLSTANPKDTCQFFRRCPGGQPMPNRGSIGMGDSLECEFCEAMVHKVVDQFNNTSAKTQVKAALEGLCKLTGPVAEKCLEAVEENFDSVYDDLIAMLDPEVVCTEIGICPGNNGLRDVMRMQKLFPAISHDTMPMARLTHAVSDVSELDVRRPVKTQGEICETCERFAGYLVRAVNDNTTQEHIEAVLDQMCVVFPKYADECQHFVDSNLEKLYDLLRRKVTVDNICQGLGLCTRQQSRTRKIATRTGQQCVLCTTVTEWLLDELKDNKTEAAILSALDRVCSMVPVDPAECRNAINTYGAMLVDYIQQNMSAQQICSELGLCGQSSRPRGWVSQPSCTVCKAVTGWLLDELKDNKTEQAILFALEKVCNVLPVDVNECTNIIDAYGSMLISLIQQDLTADEICAELSLCPQASRRVRIKGECEVCNMVASWVLDQLQDNKTDQAIIDALDSVCSALPIEATACQNFVDTYGSMLIDFLKQDLTPDEICSAIGVCASPPPPPQSQPKPVQLGCGICTVVTSWILDKVVDNNTDAAITAALEEVCSVLPVDPDECKHYIDTYSNVLFNLIRSGLTADEICTVLGVCSERRHPKPVQPEEANKQVADTCALCEVVASWLLRRVENNRTDKAIIEALDEVCAALPFESAKCLDLVNEYGFMLVDILKAEVTPAQVCSAITLCRAPPAVRVTDCDVMLTIVDAIRRQIPGKTNEETVIRAVQKVCTVVPAKLAHRCRSIVATNADDLVELILQGFDGQRICAKLRLYPRTVKAARLTPALRSPIRDSQPCTLCQIVVNVIEAELNNAKAQQEIEAALERTCSMLPRNEQRQCRNMIDVYTAYIINMLESFMSPDEICQTLGFCPTPPTNEKCEICVFVTSYVESKLSDNRTEAEIIAELSKACNYVPRSEIAMCRQTVEQFTDMIITLLVEMVPPRKICEEIRLCPVSATKVALVRKQIRQQKVKDEKCAFCKWLVAWVDEKLADNRTQDLIKEELDRGCEMVRDSDECKQMVNDYFDMIVKMIIQYADPDKICVAIGKCAAKVVERRRVEPPCLLCKFYVEELRNRLSDPVTESQVRAELDQVCNVLPVNRRECVSFVNEYTDELIKLVLEEASPDVVCQAMRVCPRSIAVRADTPKCEYCTLIMDFIAMEIKDESTDDQIIKVVEKVCDHIPVIYREDCHRMVEIEGMVIVRMLAQAMNSESICEAIRMCPAKGSNVVCAWCEYALHFIQEKLYDNSTQTEIQEELERMCDQVPDRNLAKECKEFIDFYGPSLEVLLAQRLDPSIVCPAVHACPSGHRSSAPRLASTSRCHNCMHALDVFRHDPHQLCTGANAQFLDQCKRATSSVGVAVLNSLGDDFKVCKLAKSCAQIQGTFSCNRGGCRQITLR